MLLFMCVMKNEILMGHVTTRCFFMIVFTMKLLGPELEGSFGQKLEET